MSSYIIIALSRDFAAQNPIPPPPLHLIHCTVLYCICVYRIIIRTMNGGEGGEMNLRES
jgi:hypothetical protein